MELLVVGTSASLDSRPSDFAIRQVHNEFAATSRLSARDAVHNCRLSATGRTIVAPTTNKGKRPPLSLTSPVASIGRAGARSGFCARGAASTMVSLGRIGALGAKQRRASGPAAHYTKDAVDSAALRNALSARPDSEPELPDFDEPAGNSCTLPAAVASACVDAAAANAVRLPRRTRSHKDVTKQLDSENRSNSCDTAKDVLKKARKSRRRSRPWVSLSAAGGAGMMGGGPKTPLPLGSPARSPGSVVSTAWGMASKGGTASLECSVSPAKRLNGASPGPRRLRTPSPAARGKARGCASSPTPVSAAAEKKPPTTPINTEDERLKALRRVMDQRAKDRRQSALNVSPDRVTRAEKKREREEEQRRRTRLRQLIYARNAVMRCWEEKKMAAYEAMRARRADGVEADDDADNAVVVALFGGKAPDGGDEALGGDEDMAAPSFLKV